MPFITTIVHALGCAVGAEGLAEHHEHVYFMPPHRAGSHRALSKILGAGLIKAGTLTAQSKLGRKKLINDT